MEVYGKITAEVAEKLAGVEEKLAMYPPTGQPMLVKRIVPLAKPDGSNTHAVVAELSQDVDGWWTINGKPVGMTPLLLDRIFAQLADRAVRTIESLPNGLNLDDQFERETARSRVASAVEAALEECCFDSVGTVEIEIVLRRDRTPPEVSFVFKCMVDYQGRTFELSGPHDKTLPADVERL